MFDILIYVLLKVFYVCSFLIIGVYYSMDEATIQNKFPWYFFVLTWPYSIVSKWLRKIAFKGL